MRKTIRLPDHLHQMIAQRAAVNHRTVNAEITYLLEYALDHMVEADQQAVKSLVSGPSKD